MTPSTTMASNRLPLQLQLPRLLLLLPLLLFLAASQWPTSEAVNEGKEVPFVKPVEDPLFAHWKLVDLPWKTCGRYGKVPDPHPSARIAGGQNISTWEMPSLVKILVELDNDKGTTNNYTCSGTIISTKLVLTSAQCVYGHKQLTVIKDFDNWVSVEYEVAFSCIHKYFGPVPEHLRNQEDDRKRPPFIHDVAILRLKKELVWAKTLQPACLASNVRQLREGCMVKVAGYGYLYSDGLQKGTTVEARSAKATFMQRATCLPRDEYESVLCLKPVYQYGRTCEGDGGGPAMGLVHGRQTVFGVGSYQEGKCGANDISNAMFFDVANAGAQLMRIITNCMFSKPPKGRTRTIYS